jgi:soluble lytic murein transglycosylase-like protein
VVDIVSIILSAAKSAGVSGTLLLALCTHESGGFTHNYSPMDHGSPSYGSCQVKEATAFMLGFRGDAKKLNDPKINARYAARYLQYQQKRYGDDWVRLAGSYNSGSYRESRKIPGCPFNMGYVLKVQDKLPQYFKYKMRCGNKEID